MKKITSLFLLAAMLAGMSSCGSSDTPAQTTDGNSPDTSIEDGYDYQGKNFDGYELKILNLDEQYGCYIRLDFDEQTGEMLDDAIYNRNRRLEDKLNFRMKEVVLPGGAEWETGQIAVCDALIQSVMADDDEYDAAYVPPYFKPSVVTDGYVMNLLDIPELKVYEEYWDIIVNEEMTLNDTLYTASGPLHLMTLGQAWVLLFNQDMMDDLQLEYPYQMVRDGVWTFDKLNEYASAGARLNGETSFNITETSTQILGIAGHETAASAMMYASGVRFYEKGDDGISLTLESNHLYDVMDKLAKVSTKSNGNIYYNNGGAPKGYMALFKANRALFVTCELKATMQIRDMQTPFGLVPMPKYDENQENYYSEITNFTEFLVIPKTQQNTSTVGFILDALTYESWKGILPAYYDVSLSLKGLRNEESIEMMQIVRENRGLEFTDIYSIATSVTTPLDRILLQGSGDASGAASKIASGKAAAEVKMTEFLAALDKHK